MPNKAIGERLVLSPLEPLVAGGPADALERHVRQLFHSGYRCLVVDLSNVPAIDSAGIGALLRAQAVAARTNRTLRIAGARPDVMRDLDMTPLADVFQASEPDAPWGGALPSPAVRIAAATLVGTALGAALVWAGSKTWRRRKR